MSTTIGSRYTSIMPCRWGWYCGLAYDKYQTWSVQLQGEWAHEEALILQQFIKPGDTVLDAGANTGALTLAFAAMVGHQGHVYSFEPQRFAFGCLWANVAMNSLIHVVSPMQAALSDKRGEVKVPSQGISEKLFNAGGMTLRKDGINVPDMGWEHGDLVPMIMVDDLKLERLDLLKADVEGMEPAVLRGAVETVRKCRPVIWCEDLRGTYPNTTKELMEFFSEHNYNAWTLATPVFSPRNVKLCTMNPWTDEVDMSVLAIPKEDEPVPDFVKQLRPMEL